MVLGPTALGPSVSWAAKKAPSRRKTNPVKAGKPGKGPKGARASRRRRLSPRRRLSRWWRRRPILRPRCGWSAEARAVRASSARWCGRPALQVATHRYQVLDKARVEELLAKEPSLRGCRRDDCRTAIAESLG